MASRKLKIHSVNQRPARVKLNPDQAPIDSTEMLIAFNREISPIESMGIQAAIEKALN
jgi:hypothetical protein